MALLGQPASPGPVRGFLQSYGKDLRGWVSGIAIRYVIAIVLLLSAGAGLIAAIGVGLNALFHWLEAAYGSGVAYGAVAGILVVFGIASALIGVALLRLAPPPVPRPHRHGRSVVTKAAPVIALQQYKSLAKADAGTEVLIGLAAACLLGWLIASRSQTKTK